MSERILVAMSGGVDSSVAALLLKEQGCDIVGAYMKNWINEEDVLGHCPWQQDIDDARAAARVIGIDFEVVNFIQEYRQRVVSYLVDGYRGGLTPNPDVMCNREMKFGVFLDYARQNGFGAVATGHYCLGADNPDGSRDLWEGADKNKEQSYFLAMLAQEQLRRGLFPLGKIHKPEVRARARRARLPNADKKDSQGICFIGEVRINDFLEKFIPDDPGEIVTVEGKVVGAHRGLHRHTLGQRHGMGVPSNIDKEHYVVVGKDLAKKQLVVAFDRPDSPGLYASRFLLHSLSWTNRPVTAAARLLAKPRYRDPSVPVSFTPENHHAASIVFDQPQRALAAGQVCALYDGEKLLGGGIYA